VTGNYRRIKNAISPGCNESGCFQAVPPVAIFVSSPAAFMRHKIAVVFFASARKRGQ